MSDQGALGKMHRHLYYTIDRSLNDAENIMTMHHYTDTPVKTAAAAVNAGTCLEDADYEENTLTHIGEAITAVILIVTGYRKVISLFIKAKEWSD